LVSDGASMVAAMCLRGASGDNRPPRVLRECAFA
jgi:hypothetical protein